MTRHDKRRLAVRTAGRVTSAFLEDIDILGLVAGNSQLIPGRIDRAQRLDDLAQAAQDIQEQVERLHRQGVQGRGDRRDHLRPQPPALRQAVRADRAAWHSRSTAA